MPNTWIRAVFLFTAAYDGLLGIGFTLAPLKIFAAFGVAPPNHLAYVQFPALLLIVFAAMFLRIAADPVRHRDLIPYGMGLKLAYAGTAFWYQLTEGIPSMWIPWAWLDLAMLVLFALAWQRTAPAAGTRA